MERIEFFRKEENTVVKPKDLCTLYSNINFIKQDNKVISIISSIEKEGKTYIAKELSKLYAGDNKKTCYLDCSFSENNSNIDTFGINDYLNNEKTIDDIIYTTHIKDLFIIPSGKKVSDTVYLYTNNRFIELLEYLKANFDIIIVDTPAINTHIEASIIASKCDSSLLVIKSEKTKRKDVLKAKSQINRAKVNVIGVCLNQVDK